jgi:hypothetical protein
MSGFGRSIKDFVIPVSLPCGPRTSSFADLRIPSGCQINPSTNIRLKLIPGRYQPAAISQRQSNGLQHRHFVMHILVVTFKGCGELTARPASRHAKSGVQ